MKVIEDIAKDCYGEINFFCEPCRIEIKKGLRQGDTISPKLFVATLESLFRRMKWKSGIKIDGEMLMHLLFGDDCVSFAESANKLRYMIAKLVRDQRR